MYSPEDQHAFWVQDGKPLIWASGDRSIAGPSYTFNTYAITAARYGAPDVGGDATLTNVVRLNGTSGTPTTNVHAHDEMRHEIGSILGGASPLNGNIAELLVYDRALTDSEIETVEDYLATKWGIDVVLDVTTAIPQLTHVHVYASTNQTLKVEGLREGQAQVRMYSVLGKQVVNTTLTATGNNSVDLPRLQTGVYIVHIQNAEGFINKKIIIK